MELQVLNHGDDIAVREDIAKGVLDRPGTFLGFFPAPLVPAGEAFVVIFKTENVIHLTHWTGWGTHDRSNVEGSGAVK